MPTSRISQIYASRLVLGLTISVLTSACAPQLKSTPETRAVVSSAPSWFDEPPQSKDAFIAVTLAESKDMQLAVDKAQAAGRAQIAQQIETKFGGLTKRFQEEVGAGKDTDLLAQFTQSYKLVTSQELTGTRATKQKVIPGDGKYIAYVMMEMQVGEANQALMAKLAAQKDLYTRFRSTQAYKEMNDEIDKYEASKKKP